MMETVKRHAFLLGLVAIVVVLGTALGLGAIFTAGRPAAAMKTRLQATSRRANEMLTSPIFTGKQVEKMAQEVDLRKKQYDDLLNYIRRLGAGRVPLVKDVFPQGNDIARHSFKAAYDTELKKFMDSLNAILPAPVPEREADRAGVAEENRKATMFADPKRSFFRPDWVDKQEAPDMALIRMGQENLWLQKNLVDIISGMNKEITKADKPPITEAPVKELIELRIGGDFAILAGAKMTAITGRYRPTSSKAHPAEKGEARAHTVSGRYSAPRFYQVLAFRLIVIVDQRYVGEMVRRLKDQETFITVEAWRLRPVPDSAFEKGHDFLASARQDYGKQAVVRLEVVGESLAFQLEGGRVTTVPEKKGPAAPGKATAKEGAKGAGAKAE
jgi:hypothetical protein